MTVPGRLESAALLLSLRPPTWFLRHSLAVAEIAAWLARRIVARGVSVDRRLVEAAALLHDVDKLLPADDVARRLPHGEGSAAWLGRVGHPELGLVVAAHPVTRLGTEPNDGFTAWLLVPEAGPREAQIVAYADKRAGQHLESLADRFRSWGRRYPFPEGPAEARERAAADLAAMRRGSEELERLVCDAADVEASQVRRLRWATAALRAARARGEQR